MRWLLRYEPNLAKGDIRHLEPWEVEAGFRFLKSAFAER
jgi:hypothetical protein